VRWGLRRPPASQRSAADLDEAAAAQVEVDDTPRVSWSGGPALASRAASVLLWTLLAAGPAGLVVGGYAVLSATPPVQAAPVRADLSGERTEAGEFAEQVVTAWLTTNRGSEAQASVLPDGYTAPRVPFRVGDLAVAKVEQAPDGVWSVTVGATVTDAAKHASRQYFQVPVQAGPAGMAAVTVPAVVAAPSVVEPPPLRYRQPLGLDGALGTTVEEFLTAMTAGNGDVTRYVSPGTSIRPVTPAPFRTVKLLRLDAADATFDDSRVPADGNETQLLVTAAGANASGQELPLSYALTVRARAGRWEVAELNLSPLPTPTTSSSTTGSSTAAPASAGSSSAASEPATSSPPGTGGGATPPNTNPSSSPTPR